MTPLTWLRMQTRGRCRASLGRVNDFDKKEIFEGCMPIEIMASRGKDTLRFGPLRPVGFVAEDGKRPFAVVQLRKENSEGNFRRKNRYSAYDYTRLQGRRLRKGSRQNRRTD